MNKSTEKYYSEAAERLGWKLEFDKNQAIMQAYSDAGQDVNFDITFNDEDEFIENIYKLYESYDPSQEAYLWLDSNGHGINGAPYDMGDVYDDMKGVETKLRALYDMFKKILHKAVKQVYYAISNGRFNFERRTQSNSNYYGYEINVSPMFTSYGQIGWVVNIIDARCTISYDYELRKIDIY